MDDKGTLVKDIRQRNEERRERFRKLALIGLSLFLIGCVLQLMAVRIPVQ